MKIDIVRECPILETPRAVQVSGMFDVAITEKSRVEIKGNLAIEDRDWNIGLIVGPSGSGKSTVAREVFGAAVIAGFEWASDRSILDGFPAKAGIRRITSLLNAVGFGSVPNWLRPYHVLSNGEQFRVTVARALCERPELVVIDEFTSVVDRQVAKVAAHCVQKTVRRGGSKFVGVSCHYDILEWLQPDWVFEPHVGAFEWRLLQRRPAIALEIRSVGHDIWPRFSKYHYLSPHLLNGSICVGGFINGLCVAFTSAVRVPHTHAHDIWREHRTVVLPDYQGLGLAGILADWLGEHLWRHGWRFHSVTAHPAIIAQKAASPRWFLRHHGFASGGGRRASPSLRRSQQRLSERRLAAHFVYTPPAGTPSARTPQRDGPLLGVEYRR
jgi:ABC-type ATPase involved in cell division/GNAT superfamily N-acetyltransferase